MKSSIFPIAGLLLAIIAAAVAVVPNAVWAQSGDDEGEAFSGTLKFEDEPVAGVRIEVVDAAGDFVGEEVSAEDGTWRIELPGSGVFRASLDTSTLPEGIDLRNPDRQTLIDLQ